MNGIESKINSIDRKINMLLNFDDISRQGAREIRESLSEMQILVNKILPIQNVVGSYSEKDVDNAYDKGFADFMKKYRTDL
jgi:hypothetical protein